MRATGPIVAILGAESTGKTTLAHALALSLRAQGREAVVVGEYLREFCDAQGRTPRRDEQAGIALEQARRIEAAAASGALVLADTTPLMTAVYSDTVFGAQDDYSAALAWHRRCACTLLTGLDLPWQPDGLQRTGPQVRAPVDSRVRAALARSQLPFGVVYGQGEARTAAALAALSQTLGLRISSAAPTQGASTDRPMRLSARCRECLVPGCEHLSGRATAPSSAPPGATSPDGGGVGAGLGAEDDADPDREGTRSADAGDPSASPNSPRGRPIRSFVLRTGRVGPGQARALAELGPRFVLPFARERLDADAVFGRSAPRVLEIGFGMGDATAQIAAARPGTDFLGCEVHEPGVGALLRRIGERGLANLRIVRHDAVEVLEHMIAPGSLAGIHVFFPDPWHKTRHHKRRLVQPAFVARLATRLAPGAYLHCATDWQPYAEQMLEVLSAEPLLANTAAAFAPRPDYRPLTKFEERGLRLGHGVWDLVFVRR